MKNVSKIAFAVFAAVGLAACSSNNGGNVEHFATYSKTEQGVKDLKALKANTTEAAKPKKADEVKDVVAQDGEAFVMGSKSDTQQYAQFGVFRTRVTDKDDIGELRYSVVSTKENKLDAEKALAVLTAEKEKPIEAAYRGQLAYSAKDKGKSGKEHLAIELAALNLELVGDRIAGTAEDPRNGRMFIFNASKVYNNNGELAYSGNVDVISGKLLEKESGSYYGFFAGNEAPAGDQGKEVYTKDTVKDALAETAGKIDTKSFQGAFAAKKHP